jgi:hypothetical protein
MKDMFVNLLFNGERRERDKGMKGIKGKRKG